MIAQTLHGYDQGHRLLAVGGDVSEAELSLLDRLSDLSGYVPLGTEFDRYHTGFPCGRYYAFACTWPDRGAPRAGTVLTHTLLIPAERAGAAPDLWAYSDLHRQPTSSMDRVAYRSAIEIEPDAPAAPPTPAEAEALAAIVLWFGQEDRPALWVDEARPDHVVRYLWNLLWPAARRRFSFCTFALQVRYLDKHPFGFLALPASARGSFHERARSAAWWQDGALSSPFLRERTGEPWAKLILERGAEATWVLPRFCEAEGLSIPEEAQLPTFRRFLDLDPPSAARLTAARARADLLSKLWPEIPPTHTLVRATLSRLVERQADALLAPRPFWELGDLLARPSVAALTEADPDFAATLSLVINNEARRRLGAPGGAEDLAKLLPKLGDPRLSKSVVEGVRSAVGSLAGEEQAVNVVCALLLGAAQSRAPLIAETALSALPPARRARPALEALRSAEEGDQGTLVDYLLSAAHSLEDTLFTFEIWSAQGDPARGLSAATTTVTTNAQIEPERLRPVLARVDAESRLAWALTITDDRLSLWAALRGVEAAEDLRLSTEALAARTVNAPNGSRLLLAHLASLRASALTDETLFSAPVAAAIAHGANHAPLPRTLLEHIASRVVHHLATQTMDAAQRALWLHAPIVQGALEETSSWLLFGYSTRADHRDCLPNLAAAIAEQVRLDIDPKIAWVPNLLSRPLEEAWSSALERATPDLATILSLPAGLEGWIPLAAAVLATVRRAGGATSHILVEHTFPLLYSRIIGGQLDPRSHHSLKRAAGYTWDLAKNWRHWLLDTWMSRRWPPRGLITCLGDDEELFYRIALRARGIYRGRDLLIDLQNTVDASPDLSPRWSGPVHLAIGKSALPVDYD